MKILAFGASNSRRSINKKLATYATSFFSDDEVNILDLNDFEMPIFSVEREAENGHPLPALKFIEAVTKADLVIISFAEHNGSYSTAFKNIFDWTSRVNGKMFLGKKVALLATAPGPRGGMSVLEAAKTRLPFHGATVVGSFSLPEFNKNFTDQDGITNHEYRSKLVELMDTLRNAYNAS